MALILCPYCFESFAPEGAAFRCVGQDPARCPHQEDRLLMAYQRLPTAPVLPRVFPGGTAGSSAVCPCGSRTTRRVCPHCHNDLPGQFGQTENFTVALLGSKEAGKSHYMAVLIHELFNRVGERFKASLSALDDHTIRRYKEDFRSYLFDRREVIPQTRSARADLTTRYPLVYRLTLERKGWLGKKLRIASMVFFDTAGEDLDSYDLMSSETRYVANSHGLILLVDPLQIPDVRERLGNVELLPGENTDPNDIVDRVIKLIRDFRELPANQKIPTPLALAFTKVDAVWPLFEPGSAVHTASKHPGYFDLADAERVHEELRAQVNRWCQGLDRKLAHHFASHAYFGVSALGGSPGPDGRIARGVSPFRVEDPFLWILSRLGLVPARRLR
ncbi:MAG: hypothetical protein AB1758_35115 [Candidatus Eremiobacterota bacterium]